MFTSKIIVRASEDDNSMSAKVEFNTVAKIYFFEGHIRDGVELDKAFKWIKTTLLQVEALRG
ncbi:hypothetical protein FACS1894216_02220 [Synergistales bacterium]|nr:hypothetical protein FACS1894216_02220 [Synergistales bacterium]